MVMLCWGQKYTTERTLPETRRNPSSFLLIPSSSFSSTPSSKSLHLGPHQDTSPSPLRGPFQISVSGFPGPHRPCSTGPKCSSVTSTHHPRCLQPAKFLFSLPLGAIWATGASFQELQSQSDPDCVATVGRMPPPTGCALISFASPGLQQNSLGGSPQM